MAFNPHEPRDRRGRWYNPIHASDLIAGHEGRSPEVSDEEFQQYAARGHAKVNMLRGTPAPANALRDGPEWDKVVEDAYKSSREPWGGMTVDTHTGEHVAADADKYALTMRDAGTDTVRVSPGASHEEFAAAMLEARKRFKSILRRKGSHLGVFHDADAGNIDIDPVLVTSSKEDVLDIGAYTRAVGGAYHFRSGEGFWPPHVKDKQMTNLSIFTPSLAGHVDLSMKDGQLAYWKQVLPKRLIHYTAKDGSRKTLDFNEQYLTDLAQNQIVDKVGFLLATKDNSHTMDPERWRGEVKEWAIRDNQPDPEHNGLYARIVFPTREAASAVLANPDLGVSARIREDVERSDGSSVSRGIVHVLGTLDPQVSGMGGWEPTDLSTEDSNFLDLTAETYENGSVMADDDKVTLDKPVLEYTEADIDEFDTAHLNAYIEQMEAEFGVTLDEVEDDEHELEDETAMVTLSNEAQAQIDLARSEARAARVELAQTRWEKTKDKYLAAGVPVKDVDLCEPVFNRPDNFVVDLSNEGGSEVNVTEIVSRLLDSLKGTIDLSAEAGHSGTFTKGDGTDPDEELLKTWAAQQGS